MPDEIRVEARRQTEDYAEPFDQDNASFDDGWWSDCKQTAATNAAIDFLSFTADGVEVARAKVIPPVEWDGALLRTPMIQDVVDITLFELSTDHRRRDTGRTAVHLITERYPGRIIIATSHEADEFWSSTVWRRSRGPANSSTFIYDADRANSLAPYVALNSQD